MTDDDTKETEMEATLYVPWQRDDGTPIFSMTVPHNYGGDGRFIPTTIQQDGEEKNRIRIEATGNNTVPSGDMEELAEPFDVPDADELKAGDFIFYEYTP